MRKLLLTAACSLMFAMPAQAANKCFTPADAEAEQAIRIHSELMVIGLNCQNSRYTGSRDNVYKTYREFTAKHGPMFAAYETQLLDYFKRSGVKNPEGALNDLRTAFANKISLDAAKMRPDMFCYRFGPRIDKVKGMTIDQFKKWAATPYPNHPVSQPMCK